MAVPAGSDEAWGTDGRATTFFVIMMIVAGGALAIFLVSLFWRISRSDGAEARAGPAAKTTQAEVAQKPLAKHQTPSAVRLIGLLGFAIAFLILNWAHVPPEQRHAMMLTLIYPAGLILALVMLLDKASRAWDIKWPGETTREWLYANTLMVLYVIAYLNLMGVGDPAAYGGMFWDMVHVAGFLLVIWILDRKTSRLRFLLIHAWLIALPILLLVWRSQMGMEAVEDISWWDTIWPFFFLALVFFVVELIILIATDEGGDTGIGTFKGRRLFADLLDSADLGASRGGCLMRGLRLGSSAAIGFGGGLNERLAMVLDSCGVPDLYHCADLPVFLQTVRGSVHVDHLRADLSERDLLGGRDHRHYRLLRVSLARLSAAHRQGTQCRSRRDDFAARLDLHCHPAQRLGGASGRANPRRPPDSTRLRPRCNFRQTSAGIDRSGHPNRNVLYRVLAFEAHSGRTPSVASGSGLGTRLTCSYLRIAPNSLRFR